MSVSVVLVSLLAVLPAEALALKPRVEAPRRRAVCAAAVASVLATPAQGSPDISLSALLDGVEEAQEDAGAVALRERQQLEAQKMAERDAVAIARMSAAEEAKRKERAALAASGVPPCPTGGPFGSNTGVLSAKVCARERDGEIESSPRTGAFLIF